jgi:hypothetical protein
MASAPALLIDLGGTKVAVDYFDHFTSVTEYLSECHRCSGLTHRPGEHLEWHISIGDNPLAQPTGEHHDH